MANENQMTITINLDETSFKRYLESQAQTEAVKAVAEAVKKVIFKPSYSYGYSWKEDRLEPWVMDFVKETIIANHKDEIIQAAARELADSMRRSKPVRERFCDILGEELK